jgi:hypothetical protein
VVRGASTLGGFESPENVTEGQTDKPHGDGAQKQSKSCRVTTSTATKVSHGEIKLVQQLKKSVPGSLSGIKDT